MDSTQTTIIQLHAGLGGMCLGLADCLRDIGQVCYVEGELLAIESLKQKIEAKVLPMGPIWSGIDTFVPEPFRGLVHLISGTFIGDCWEDTSDWSADTLPTADNRRARIKATLRIISVVEPPWVFLEIPANYTDLSSIIQGLEVVGYQVAGRLVATEEVGATHDWTNRYLLAGMGSSMPFRLKETVYCKYPEVEGAFDLSPSRKLTEDGRMARTIPFRTPASPVYTPDWPAGPCQSQHVWEEPRLLEPKVARTTHRTSSRLVGGSGYGVGERIRLLCKESIPPQVSLAFRLLAGDWALKQHLECIV